MLIKHLKRLRDIQERKLLGKNPFFIIHPQDRDRVYTRYLERIDGKREAEAYSWRIITKDGEIKWITAKPNRITKDCLQ